MHTRAMQAALTTETEADVLFMFVNDATGEVVVYPYWEFEGDETAIMEQFLRASVTIADDFGAGTITGAWIDKRDKTV